MWLIEGAYRRSWLCASDLSSLEAVIELTPPVEAAWGDLPGLEGKEKSLGLRVPPCSVWFQKSQHELFRTFWNKASLMQWTAEFWVFIPVRKESLEIFWISFSCYKTALKVWTKLFLCPLKLWMQQNWDFPYPCLVFQIWIILLSVS